MLSTYKSTFHIVQLDGILCNVIAHILFVALITGLFCRCKTDTDKINAAYEFVRDRIHHSADINSSRVTRTTSEVLLYGQDMWCKVPKSKSIRGKSTALRNMMVHNTYFGRILL